LTSDVITNRNHGRVRARIEFCMGSWSIGLGIPLENVAQTP
jgi:hypothetical protein